MADESRCSATTKAGKPCRMKALVNTSPPACFNHVEGLAADRAREKARLAGGMARGRQQSAEAGTIEEAEGEFGDWGDLVYATDVEEALSHVTRETIAGRMSPRAAAAATGSLKLLLERAVKENRIYRPDGGGDDA